MAVAQTRDQPTVSEVFRLAVRLHREGKYGEAAEHYRSCLRTRPLNAQIWSNYGALLRSEGKLDASEAAHRKAVELAPDLESARSNLANTLCDLGQAAEAVAIRRGLWAAKPDDVERLRDLCVALRGAREHKEVIRLIDAAEERLGRAEDILRVQRSLSHLMLGQYPQGFRDFESRYVTDEVGLPKDAPWPRWQGEDLAGKSIAVLPEQGFGDAVLMARFLPALKARGATVTHVVKPPLARLLAKVEGVDRIAGAATRGQHFDYYTPNMSLPHFLGHYDPPPPARLVIPEDSRARARKLLAPFESRFRIGVVWTGSLQYRANNRRSASPEQFAALAVEPGVQLFSLYKGEAHGDFVDSGYSGPIMDTCGKDRDFADTAAIIEGMDLLITTDTAVVHIAASMGKPVWNMLHYEGFWLYGEGDSTPWYPSMRLFRQPAPGDWDSVFAEVRAALRAHLRASGRAG